MTTTAVATTKRHLTKLNPAAARHVHRSRGRELWSTESACGRWRYERDEFPGTPWFVLDTTTSQPAPHPFRTLAAARAWTWQQEDDEAKAAIAQHGGQPGEHNPLL